MFRDFKGVLTLKKVNIISTATVVFGLMIFAFVLNLIIGEGEDEIGARALATIMGTTGYVFLNMFIKLMFLSDEVPRGLSFGVTRRSLFLNERLYDLLEVVIVAIVIGICWENRDISIVTKVAAIVFGIFMYIEGIGGNAVCRYGKTAYWIYYIVVFVLMIGLPKLFAMVQPAHDAIAAFVEKIINSVYNQLFVWLIILVFIGIGMLINWLTFRKVPVNANV